MRDRTRRRFVGATGAAIAAGLAGCTGGDDGSDGSDGDDGNDGDGSNGGDGSGSSDGGDGGDGTDGGGGSDGGDGGSGEGTLTLGVLLPFTGEYSWVGSNVMPVVEMLAEEITDDGGVDGRQVSVVRADTEATVDAAVSATQSLINVEEVDVLVGPTSLTFTGVQDLIRENGVPAVSPSAGTTELDGAGGEYIFRTVPSDSLGGRAISSAARNEDLNEETDYENMGLMVGEAPALQSFEAPIRSSFEEFGGTVTRTLDFSTGKSSYQAEVDQMLDSDPDIVALVASPEDSAKIMRAAFQAGYEGNWFVTQDQTNQDFLDLVEDQITDGIFGLIEADNPEAVDAGRVDEFGSRLEEYSGSGPGIFAKNSYDAVTIAALAARQASADGEVSRETIAANVPTVANPPERTVTDYAEGASAIADGTDVDYEGLVGPCDFDENGDIRSPFGIMRARDGEWEEVSVLPASEL